MNRPLVSVITPTWQRHGMLVERCIPSVAAQTYPNIEHVVVSDGVDNALYARIRDACRGGTYHHLRYAELPAHDERARWGHWARLAGIDLARGELIAYLDDDNAYRPQHLELLAAALVAAPDARFVYSRMLMHFSGQALANQAFRDNTGMGLVSTQEIGADPPSYGQVDTSILMHYPDLLRVATWQPSLPSIDWDLVHRWLIAGVKWAFVPQVTLDYYK